MDINDKRMLLRSGRKGRSPEIKVQELNAIMRMFIQQKKIFGISLKKVAKQKMLQIEFFNDKSEFFTKN